MQSSKAVPQANVKLQAAQTILDRVGVTKKEKLDINHKVTNSVFILPEKKTIDITPIEDLSEDGTKLAIKYEQT